MPSEKPQNVTHFLHCSEQGVHPLIVISGSSLGPSRKQDQAVTNPMVDIWTYTLDPARPQSFTRPARGKNSRKRSQPHPSAISQNCSTSYCLDLLRWLHRGQFRLQRTKKMSAAGRPLHQPQTDCFNRNNRLTRGLTGDR